jgi:cellulose synthase/poly-beta-1,6-N-acetylglucosamine synthase-like glycosyltransferase
MSITVVIPTYRRVEELENCLKGLRGQSRLADEIIVVIRSGDEETHSFLRASQPSNACLRVVTVGIPGQVAALNAGLDNSKGDIIVFTDDDAAPESDWLKNIEKCFAADPEIGGAGGKDNLYINGKLENGRSRIVGKILWYGRLVGNHHLGFGGAREVDTLKGSNMGFRRDAIKGLRFNARLRGEGAQVRNDTGLCLAVKKAGWKLIYDPGIRVDHYQAKRYEENKRGNFSRRAVEDGAYNETLVLMEYLKPLNRICCFAFLILVGNIFTPGLAQFIRILPREGRNAFLRLSAAFKGRWECFKFLLRKT